MKFKSPNCVFPIGNYTRRTQTKKSWYVTNTSCSSSKRSKQDKTKSNQRQERGNHNPRPMQRRCEECRAVQWLITFTLLFFLLFKWPLKFNLLSLSGHNSWRTTCTLRQYRNIPKIDTPKRCVYVVHYMQVMLKGDICMHLHDKGLQRLLKT